MQSLDEEVNDIINDEELVDSEDEREKQEEEKEKFELSITFSTPVPQQLKNIVLAPQGHPQALTKIVLHGKLLEIGKVEATYHEKKSEALKIFYTAEHQLMVLHPQEGLKSVFVNQLVDQLFGQLSSEGAQIQRIVVLDTVYKTNYSTTDTGYMENVGSSFPIRFYKTTHSKNDAALNTFTQSLQPAGVLNLVGGLNAALLIHAELNGISAAQFVTIIDSHYVTSETLQGFTPIVRDILQVNNFNMDEIHRSPAFKDVLKEANNRNNNIYN
ncbi:UNKNOWN [Stylonychia lemnae]|uniref:Proteasome assembly chaperone 1 n=1 Tax=Stylonychia lemnae TaxID=5949 RepID=A0A078B7Q2_STYLE|nr:UNKNOWN [Stylonychia lemnae]|eukprot:CDW90540.1 UNKNOWN [Stylonychia lemnae]